MSVPAPHFLLYAEAAQAADAIDSNVSRWRFVLRSRGGETSLEAADEEPEAGPERLELLAVVRGLEALESPSRVTLLTGSRHIRRGLDFGLSQWRENDWQWERYGRMTPGKTGDLWQRLDRLLEIHAVECQPAKLEKADDLASPPPAARRAATSSWRRTRQGKQFRIDAAEPKRAEKSEVRSRPLRGGARSKANPKLQSRNAPNKSRFDPAKFLLLSLSRISNFLLRVLSYGNVATRK